MAVSNDRSAMFSNIRLACLRLRRARSVVLASALAVAGVGACSSSTSTPLETDPTTSPFPADDAGAEASDGSDPAETTPFPAGSEFCTPKQDGTFDGNAIVIQRSGNDGYHDFAIGGGCILRPLREVWAAAQNGAAWAWSDATERSFESQTPTDPRVAFLFEAAYSAGSSPFTQDWTMQYFHVLSAGTTAQPLRVILTYKKVQGTSYISYWQSTVDLRVVHGDMTAVAVRDDLSAALQGPSDAEAAVRDVVTRLRTTPAVWNYLQQH
jgi:hypothetical protein